MSTDVLQVPGGVPFSGFYYPEILRELLTFLRLNRSRLGLTDENELEVHVQLLRAFALVGHLNNTRLDTVATELIWGSSKLLESVKRLLRFVGVELASASPAACELLCKLSAATVLDQVDFVPGLSEFSTDSVPPITYEALDAIDLQRTDRVGSVFGCEQVDSGTLSGHTLGTSITSPDVVQRSAGVWPALVVGQQLHIPSLAPGEFRVIERLNDTDVRVAEVPTGDTPAFTTVMGIASWSLRAFTADHATAANTNSSLFTPIATPGVGECLYVAHPDAMTTALGFDLSTPAAGIVGVWEYFDNESQGANPYAVTDLGSALELDLETLLGSANCTGAVVTVKLLKTGVQERCVSFFSGGRNKVVTTGLLGQVTPSTSILDYAVQADWVPFDSQDDGTFASSSAFGQDGTVTWELPETQQRQWVKAAVNLVEGYWSRFRIVSVGVVTAPIFDRIYFDRGDQYIKPFVTQGATVGPQVLGSSAGTANQRFSLPETPYLDDTATVEVDETGSSLWVEYTIVKTFLNSQATDRHCKLEADAESRATIIFGDGERGRVPPAGVNNIRATYRVGGDVDGNVGPLQITSNTEGVTGLSEVYNPRAAVGWREKEGGSEAGLLRVKRDAPGEVATRDTASTAADIERMAVKKFISSAGAKLVARAFAVEEGFGAKTVKLLVVGEGGVLLSRSQLDELDLYFNGDKYAVPPVKGVLLTNHRVVGVNYEPRDVAITATVRWPGGSAERAKNALLAYLTPLAVSAADGVTYAWAFGGKVSLSRIHSLLHSVSTGVIDVPYLTINGVQASLVLGENELPATAASSIVVNIQES